MKLSVCVPTFNHASYIATMIEGALTQKTTFDFEIVIGDDGSTDGAADIIRSYADRFPNIRAYLHPTNLGPAHPPEFAGRNNVLLLVKACCGQYVAMCEGDDYWTDPLKLQKQVDFLDAHPDYAICHHNMLVTYEDDSPSHTFNADSQDAESSIEDVLADKWFMATASWVYRNVFLEKDFAYWHQYAAAGDWALIIQLAATGKIHYLPDVMGVYRKHSAGLSHVHAVTNRFFLENRKQMFERVNAWLEYRYDRVLQKTIDKYKTLLAQP